MHHWRKTISDECGPDDFSRTVTKLAERVALWSERHRPEGHSSFIHSALEDAESWNPRIVTTVTIEYVAEQEIPDNP